MAQDGTSGDKADPLDYYALLNVGKQATKEEVKAAYTKLARVLHPDKYARSGSLTVEEKREAQELFIIVDRAYKILSNDTDRLIYDTYGPEGLRALHHINAENRKKQSAAAFVNERNSESLAVGFVDEKGKALRDKVLGQVQLERDLEAIGRFNVRGALQANVNAIGLVGNAFAPPSEYDLMFGRDQSLVFEMPSLTSLVIQQSVDVPVSKFDSLSLGAQVLTRSGRAFHSLTLVHEHTFSESTSSEVTLTNSLRDPLGISVKGNRTLDQYTKGTLELVLRDGFQSGLSVQAARKLNDTMTGVLQLGFGVESGLVLQLNHSNRFRRQKYRSKKEQEEEFYRTYYANSETSDGENADEDGYPSFSDGAYKSFSQEESESDEELMRSFFNNASAALFVSGGGFGLQTSWTRSFSPKTFGKLQLKFGTSNIELELTSSRALSAHSKGNISLAFGFSGVRITLRYDRGGMRYVLPLTLAPTFSLGATVFGTVAPMLVNFAFVRVLQPYRERRRARIKFNTDTEMLEEREKAKRQLAVISTAAEARRSAAEAAYGLVILRARYGTQLHKVCDWRSVAPPKLQELDEVRERPRAPSDWDIDEDDSHPQPPISEETLSDIQEGEKDVYDTHPPNIDVTDQLNFMCNDTELSLHGGKTKANLVGFYNPCKGRAGVEPRLYIRYKLASWVFEYTCDDLEPVRLPNHRAVLIGNVLTDKSVDFSSQ